jgi:hypothetical protein
MRKTCLRVYVKRWGGQRGLAYALVHAHRPPLRYVLSSTSRATHSHRAAHARTAAASSCWRALQRPPLARAISPGSTTCVGLWRDQARAAAGTRTPCSSRTRTHRSLHRAAPAATHACSRKHDSWMRERLVELRTMDATTTRGCGGDRHAFPCASD